MQSTAQVPEAFDGVTADWLGSVIGADVEDAVAEPMAITGATADMARIRLSYSSGDGPDSVIAKMRGRTELKTAIDAALGLYAREARFYATLAPEVPIVTPRVFHVGDGTDTPLLLEDLGSLRAGDQTVGLTTNDAERTLDVLARMHAAYWDSPVLGEGWLAEPAQGVYGQMSVQLMMTGLPVLQERYRGHGFDRGIDALAAVAPRWQDALQACTQGPHTVVHNDCRLDNMFFTDDGAPVLVDWQVVARTRGTQDVANLLAGSMEPDLLSVNWETLLRRYHESLAVPAYSWDQCVEHYRQNVLYPLGAGMAALGALELGDRGAQIGEVMVMRPLRHAIELDSFATV
jgi:hypothetical protein